MPDLRPHSFLSLLAIGLVAIYFLLTNQRSNRPEPNQSGQMAPGL